MSESESCQVSRRTLHKNGADCGFLVIDYYVSWCSPGQIATFHHIYAGNLGQFAVFNVGLDDHLIGLISVV